ncbi:MAG: rod shape-determining protein RodA [Candidatus Omnitrophica bacterium]|jgi:rod shape determining protein RodA|nr:rod shape-determining protein RodA [Candidatus Omnitrophota bacterium]
MIKKIYSENTIVWLTYIIIVIGLLLQFGASNTVETHQIFLKQIVWVIAGTIIFLFLRKFDYRNWQKLSLPLYIFFILLLMAVLVIGYGPAKRWIHIAGPIDFQPSEFFKIVFILILAKYFSSKSAEKLPVFLGGIILAGIPAFLILKEPNLGTCLLFIIIFFSLAYIAGAKKKHIFTILLIAVLISPFLWMGLKKYQRERLVVFLAPWKNPLGMGYNLLQSKIAIGSGGLLGTGYMKGTQTELSFLPAYHTDFIFCVLSEQFGLIGVIVFILIYLWFLERIAKIAFTTQDNFAKLVSSGILILFFLQIFINIGMASGILPVAGIPLPFVSYGGSSILASFIEISIIYNISRNSALF